MAPAVSDSLTLPATVDRLDEARRWLAGHCRAAGFDDEAVWALELAITEAISNVIRHAYGGDPARKVELEVRVDEERLAVSVTDTGRPFDRGHAPSPDFDNPSPGGYGLYLIDELMDEVVRDSSPERGNRLTLVKYRRRSDG